MDKQNAQIFATFRLQDSKVVNQRLTVHNRTVSSVLPRDHSFVMDPAPPFEEIVEGLRTGDDGAADVVFWRFAHRLIALARKKLDDGTRAKVDPEDVVQSVFRSFFTRQTDGQFHVDSWDGLWAILTVITVRKCLNKQKHYRADRRDIRREVGVPGEHDIPRAISQDPTPEQAAILTEVLQSVMRRMGSRHRLILSLHLEGYSVPEISTHLGRTERTVRRVLLGVREQLEENRKSSE